MAHEVIKRVGKRAYRYRVESFRDTETKKVRSRWTYVGVALADGCGTAGDAGAAPRPQQRDTRDRLVRAFLELLEEHPYAAVTAGMVATRAGLAHGTFYRHFRDKRAAFMAALERVREELDREGPSLDGPLGDLAAERERLRSWLVFKLSSHSQHPGILRAFLEAVDDDPELNALRAERKSERIAAFARYVERIGAATDARFENPAALARALAALLDGALRESIAYGTEVPSATVAGVAELLDRAIFSAAAGKVSATETRVLSSISK